ncbi:MAG TPA: amidohydrolase [Pyrinomonadaceae bacterium]|nr:amidohydrolase [Pyrinomonadaceae bacterium]
MKKILFPLILGIMVPISAFGQQAPADLILFNGKVFTADPAHLYAQAIAIRGERIIAVGTSAEIAVLGGPKTRRIDLEGRLVIPGINDAHYHHTPDPPGYRLQFNSLEPGWQEVLDALGNAIKQTPEGTWIFGSIGSAVVADPQATRFALDHIAPDHPVLLRAFYLHGYIINSKAMTALGITDEEPDPMAGYFERVSGSKRITGKSFEYADWQLSRRLASTVSDEEAIKSMRAFADEAVRYGITSVQNMSFLPAGRYVHLLTKARLPIRIRVIRFPMTSVRGRDLTEGRNLPLHPRWSPLVTVNGTKWILDGTPLERGAALRRAYRDRPGWSGRLNFSAEEIASMIREALARKDQLLVHCAGDKPVEVLFNAMEGISSKVDWAKMRVRIEHGDGVIGDLIPRARRLGVVVVQNPSHFTFTEILHSRYGADIQFLPLRSLLDARIPLAFGSDGPLNPYLNIMFAVIHPARPTEAITLEQAIEAYTRGSAFAEHAEQEKGSIVKGKLADLAVLSQDIFTVTITELPKTQSLLTIIGGKLVYDAGVLKQ